MRARLPLALLLGALTALALPAMAATSNQNEVVIDAGSGHEETLTNLKAGQVVTYSYRVSNPSSEKVRFDVHAHTDTGLEYVKPEVSATDGSGSFTVARDGDYYLLWQNPTKQGMRVQFQWSVSTPGANTQAAQNETPTPALAVPFALALAGGALALARRP